MRRHKTDWWIEHFRVSVHYNELWLCKYLLITNSRLWSEMDGLTQVLPCTGILFDNNIVCENNIFISVRNCLVFAHLPVLTRDLNEYVSIWNSHHIRPVRLAGCPSGRPDDMFDMPEEFGEI